MINFDLTLPHRLPWELATTWRFTPDPNDPSHMVGAPIPRAELVDESYANVRDAIEEADGVILEHAARKFRARKHRFPLTNPDDVRVTMLEVTDFDRVMFGIEYDEALRPMKDFLWRRAMRRTIALRPTLAAWQTDLVIIAVVLALAAVAMFGPMLVDWLWWNAWTLGLERWLELSQRSSGRIDPR